jgi:hypothetical protein
MTTTAIPGTTPVTGSARKTALVAGALYLITFAASIPALILIGPVLNHTDYIVSTGADTRVIWGCILDIVNAFAAVGTAVTLFPVVRRQNEAGALGFVTSRLIEAAVIMIGVVCLLAVVTLRQDVGGPGATNSATLVATGRALVAVRDWTFLLGPGTMPAFNALLLGTLLFRSRLVPRVIPAIGLVGAPLLLAATGLVLFGYFSQVSGPSFLLTVPIAVWEFAVGVYMLVKGFRPTPLTTPTPLISPTPPTGVAA